MVIFAEASFQYEKKLSQVVFEILNKKKSNLEQIIESGQKDGSIRNDISANHISNVFMGGMRFTILKWRLDEYKLDLNIEAIELAKTYRTLLS